jgi:hypothetical protein
VIVGTAGLVNAWLLLRSEENVRSKARRLALALTILGCVLLVVGSVPGFDENQPASVELKYLLIPAVMLASGGYAILRLRASGAMRS